MPESEPIESLSETMLIVGAKQFVLKRTDAEQIKQSLVSFLERNEIDFRDDMLRFTRNASTWIDGEGIVRIGRWLLQARKAKPILLCRLSQGEYRGLQAVAYLTPATDEIGWRVNEIHLERIKLA